MSEHRSPITVLDLRDSPWVDGPGRTILDCAETLDASRVRVVIGAFDGGSADGTAYETEARARDLEVYRIHEKRSLDFNVLRRVVELGRLVGADAVHSHDFRSDIFAVACANRLDIPMIATVHGWIANDFKGWTRTAFDKLVLSRADHVIAVSEETRERLRRWVRPERCTVIPNAVRVEQYQPMRGPGGFRASHGVADDELLIANIGRLSPEKGQTAFLTAARDVLRRHHDARFVLFGVGPDRAELERFVDQNDLRRHVIFAGYREDMRLLYNELDLVVQSSSTEGMPNVVIEALLMETPVIATDVGGTREVLKDGLTGVLIASGEHDALVASIEEFLANRHKFTRMGCEGRKDMLLRFDHTHRVNRLAEVYETLICTRRGRR